MSEAEIWARNAEVPLFVVLGHNREGFRWDAPEHHALIVRHVVWYQDQERAGCLLGAGPVTSGEPLADAVAIFAAPGHADLVRLLEEDPLVVAGVRRYEISGWLLNQGTARDAAQGATTDPSAAGTP